MTLTPVPGFAEEKLNKIVELVQPLLTPLSNMVDESGNALTVPMYSEYSQLGTTYPNPMVFVELRLGKSDFTSSENLLYEEDDVNRNPTRYWHGISAPGSQINFQILARSHPERMYIIDTLLSGIPSAITVDPLGNLFNSALIKGLGAWGIVPEGFDAPSIPHVDLAAPRLQGQPFTATLTLRAWIDLTWTVAPQTGPSSISTGSTINIPGNVLFPPIQIDPFHTVAQPPINPPITI